MLPAGAPRVWSRRRSHLGWSAASRCSRSTWAPTGFASRITAAALALFGSQYGLDPRRLVGFVRDISVISEPEYERLRPPAAIARSPADLRNHALEFSGMYEDGWASEHVVAWLTAPKSARRLVVRGSIPDIGGGAASEIDVKVDGVSRASQPLLTGDFEIGSDVNGDGRRHSRIHLQQRLAASAGRRPRRVGSPDVRWLRMTLRRIEPASRGTPEVRRSASKRNSPDGWDDRRTRFGAMVRGVRRRRSHTAPQADAGEAAGGGFAARAARCGGARSLLRSLRVARRALRTRLPPALRNGYPARCGGVDGFAFDVVQGDVESPPFEPASKDWILIIHALHHLDGPEKIGRILDRAHQIPSARWTDWPHRLHVQSRRVAGFEALPRQTAARHAVSALLRSSGPGRVAAAQPVPPRIPRVLARLKNGQFDVESGVMVCSISR